MRELVGREGQRNWAITKGRNRVRRSFYIVVFMRWENNGRFASDRKDPTENGKLLKHCPRVAKGSRVLRWKNSLLRGA